eukprot:m.391260 g.391260  ORF g.391260 m.391260 type:complete len:285 (-) comp28313_c0_seq2:4244-5098(-)
MMQRLPERSMLLLLLCVAFAMASVNTSTSTKCPPAAWHGWKGWIVADSPFAAGHYGQTDQLFDVKPAVRVSDRPKNIVDLGRYVVQLLDIETWMELEKPNRCPLFDSVLNRLGARDSATRRWCRHNHEMTVSTRGNRRTPKTVRCVCSDAMNTAWLQCRDSHGSGCSAEQFVRNRRYTRSNGCEVQQLRVGDNPTDDDNPMCVTLLQAHSNQYSEPPVFPSDCRAAFPGQISGPRTAYKAGEKTPCFRWQNWRRPDARIVDMYNCSQYEAQPEVVLLRQLSGSA